MQAAECGPGKKRSADWHFAIFLWHQFGVQTMAEYRWFFGRAGEADETKKDESGTWALHTLGEDETIGASRRASSGSSCRRSSTISAS